MTPGTAWLLLAACLLDDRGGPQIWFAGECCLLEARAGSTPTLPTSLQSVSTPSLRCSTVSSRMTVFDLRDGEVRTRRKSTPAYVHVVDLPRALQNGTSGSQVMANNDGHIGEHLMVPNSQKRQIMI